MFYCSQNTQHLSDSLTQDLRKGFPCGSDGKESACDAGNQGSVPGLGRSPREGKGYPLQYSGLENSKDCTVPGVTKSRIRLSNFHFHFGTLTSGQVGLKVNLLLVGWQQNNAQNSPG